MKENKDSSQPRVVMAPQISKKEVKALRQQRRALLWFIFVSVPIALGIVTWGNRLVLSNIYWIFLLLCLPLIYMFINIIKNRIIQAPDGSITSGKAAKNIGTLGLITLPAILLFLAIFTIRMIPSPQYKVVPLGTSTLAKEANNFFVSRQILTNLFTVQISNNNGLPPSSAIALADRSLFTIGGIGSVSETGRQALLKIDWQTGTVLWQANTSPNVAAYLQAYNGIVYATPGYSVTAYDAETTQVVWDVRLQAPPYFLQYENGQLYTEGWSKGYYSAVIDSNSGVVERSGWERLTEWERPSFATMALSNIAYTENYAFFIDSTGSLQAYNLVTGSTVGTLPLYVPTYGGQSNPANNISVAAENNIVAVYVERRHQVEIFEFRPNGTN